MEYLLTLKSVDPSAFTVDGNTGLHIAAIHDTPDIANLLIDHEVGCPTQATNNEVQNGSQLKEVM